MSTGTGIALSRAQQVFACLEVTKGTPVFPTPALPAKGKITLTGIPVANEAFVIGSQTFTFKSARGAPGQVTIGADAAGTCTNIITAVNLDIPTLVIASQGAGTTVIITAVALGLSGNSIIFTESATNITVDGAGVLGITQAGFDGYMIVASDSWDINQQPAFTDSPEIVNSRDILDRFQDMMPAGTWTGKLLIRPYGTAGVAPMGDVLFQSLQGAKTVNAGVSVVYAQALTKPSFTLWVEKDHTVFFLTGCTLTKAKISVGNKGAVEGDLSGEGMMMGWAGTDALSADKAAGQTVLSVANAKKFTPNSYIYNVTKNDTNGGLGYEITAIDAVANTITLATALPSGGWSNNDVIKGFLPAGVITGHPIEARYTTVLVNNVATTMKSSDINIDDPAKYMDDEITPTGYIQDYVEDVRNTSGTLNLNFRKDALPTFYDAINDNDQPFVITFGSVAGKKFQITMNRVSYEVPKVSDAKPVTALAINFKPLGTSGEDSLSLKFF
jgi:hypothetical protein